ncbi:MAG: 30S ribosomal protein S12 methylthiotransferase RimO [Elusimicrobiota bacterium]|nr:30S ribosomal protein S12 methylthiotransferase RimO [Elusimicrobiota bacterium]
MRVALIVLGCPKNTVEAQYLLGKLRDCNYGIADNVEEADIVVVHTCSFIKKARMESQKTIRALLRLKQKKNLMVFVTGCLPQLLKESILKEFPQIDGYIGTGSLHMLTDLVENLLPKIDWTPGGLNNAKSRVLDSKYAYLKIAEGCNHRCSFCIIPSLRGAYKSVKMQSLIDEARALAENGVKELILIAQDTSNYGIDLYRAPVLDKLLSKLSAIQELKWIRLLYGYPQNISGDLLKVISENPKVCKYLDIPIQHISAKILSLMKRPQNTRKTIEKIRAAFPQIMLRTSLIAGFPQENKADLKEILDFIKEGHFLYCGVFGYSDNKGTAAYSMNRKICAADINERKILMENAQYEVFKRKIEALKNRETEIFISNCRKDGGVYKIEARTSFQAPEIDGKTFLTDANPAEIGSFRNVKIVSNNGYNLKATENLRN